MYDLQQSHTIDFRDGYEDTRTRNCGGHSLLHFPNRWRHTVQISLNGSRLCTMTLRPLEYKRPLC
jgi:hypothetical protein